MVLPIWVIRGWQVFYEEISITHCVKSVHSRNFSGPYFSVFGLNTDSYGVSLRIQSKCGKIRTRKFTNTGTFHAMTTITHFSIVINLSIKYK